MSLLFSTRKLCKQQKFDKRTNIIRSRLRLSLILILSFIAAALMLEAFFLAVPVSVYIFNKQVMPLMPIEIMYCDQSTTAGFYIGLCLPFLLFT